MCVDVVHLCILSVCVCVCVFINGVLYECVSVLICCVYGCTVFVLCLHGMCRYSMKCCMYSEYLFVLMLLF